MEETSQVGEHATARDDATGVDTALLVPSSAFLDLLGKIHALGQVLGLGQALGDVVDPAGLGAFGPRKETDNHGDVNIPCSLGDLMPRETEVLSLMAQGYSNWGIAEELGITPETVEDHVCRIFEALAPGHQKRFDPRVRAVLHFLAELSLGRRENGALHKNGRQAVLEDQGGDPIRRPAHSAQGSTMRGR